MSFKLYQIIYNGIDPIDTNSRVKLNKSDIFYSQRSVLGKYVDYERYSDYKFNIKFENKTVEWINFGDNSPIFKLEEIDFIKDNSYINNINAHIIKEKESIKLFDGKNYNTVLYLRLDNDRSIAVTTRSAGVFHLNETGNQKGGKRIKKRQTRRTKKSRSTRKHKK